MNYNYIKVIIDIVKLYLKLEFIYNTIRNK